MQSLEKALRENHTVHVFPEMTRAEFGESQMGRFTLAPFQKAIQSGVPVVPIAIWGTDFLWPKGTYAIASSGPLVVKSLNPIDSRQFDSAANLSSHVKEVLQKEVDQLQAQFPYGTR